MYVSVPVNNDVDWKAGDQISFVSSNICQLTSKTGLSVLATDIVTNTVTLITSSQLEINISGDTVTIQGFVPEYFDGYQLQESSDLINWTPVPGSENLDQTIFEGKFYFTLPYDPKSSAKYYKLVLYQSLG